MHVFALVKVKYPVVNASLKFVIMNLERSWKVLEFTFKNSVQTLSTALSCIPLTAKDYSLYYISLPLSVVSAVPLVIDHLCNITCKQCGQIMQPLYLHFNLSFSSPSYSRSMPGPPSSMVALTRSLHPIGVQKSFCIGFHGLLPLSPPQSQEHAFCLWPPRGDQQPLGQGGWT